MRRSLGLVGARWAMLGVAGRRWGFLVLPGARWGSLGPLGPAGARWGSQGVAEASWGALGLAAAPWARGGPLGLPGARWGSLGFAGAPWGSVRDFSLLFRAIWRIFAALSCAANGHEDLRFQVASMRQSSCQPPRSRFSEPDADGIAQPITMRVCLRACFSEPATDGIAQPITIRIFYSSMRASLNQFAFRRYWPLCAAFATAHWLPRQAGEQRSHICFKEHFKR